MNTRAFLVQALSSALALTVSAAYAEITLGQDTMSWHSKPAYKYLGKTHDFNNSNPGMYLIFDNGLVLGTLENSYRDNNVYGAWLWHPFESKRFGIMLGATTGYASTPEHMPILPLIVPSYVVALDQSNVRVSWMPAFNTNRAQVLHLSFEHNF